MFVMMSHPVGGTTAFRQINTVVISQLSAYVDRNLRRHHWNQTGVLTDVPRRSPSLVRSAVAMNEDKIHHIVYEPCKVGTNNNVESSEFTGELKTPNRSRVTQ